MAAPSHSYKSKRESFLYGHQFLCSVCIQSGKAEKIRTIQFVYSTIDAKKREYPSKTLHLEANDVQASPESDQSVG